MRVFNAAVHKNLIDFFHSMYRRLVIISRLSICRYDPTQREERVAYRVAIPPQILLCHTQSVTTVCSGIASHNRGCEEHRKFVILNHYINTILDSDYVDGKKVTTMSHEESKRGGVNASC